MYSNIQLLKLCRNCLDHLFWSQVYHKTYIQSVILQCNIYAPKNNSAMQNCAIKNTELMGRMTHTETWSVTLKKNKAIKNMVVQFYT